MKTVELYARVRHAVLIEGISERAAADRFGINARTVSKMLKFSVPPGYVRRKPPFRPKLDESTGVIDEILATDRDRPKKQRHTSKQIFERLRDEHRFTGKITIVKDYVAGWCQRTQEMFVPLVHPPGHAQADYGEAIGVIGGVECKIHFFAMGLPHSDAIFVAGYPAETTEAAPSAPMLPLRTRRSTSSWRAKVSSAIRLPANQVLQESIAYLLKRPVGRPPNHVQRFHASFSYQAKSWSKSRRVVAKVEWHPGELYPTVGFIVTNMTRPAERVVAFYNQRGTAEQWIKEGKNAIKWTRLSCCSFAANAVRLQLHALAYNLANFMRTLALPEAVKQWSLTSLREKLVKIGAKVVRHGRYVIFQMAEVAVPRELFQGILRLIAELRPPPAATPACGG
jgi:hypothetical protein